MRYVQGIPMRGAMRWDELDAPTPVAIRAIRASMARLIPPRPTIGQWIYRQTATVDQMMRARLFSRTLPTVRKRTRKE